MRKFNKFLSLLLLVCMLLALSPVSRAASKAGLSLSTSHSGSEWTVTVKLTGSKKPNMIEFCLDYDSSLLKLKSVKAGSAFSGANAPSYSTPKTGRVLFAWEALTGLKDGKLLVLTFSEKSGKYGTADIWFNEDYNTVVKDAEMNDIAVTLSDAEIEIEDPDDDWDEPYDPDDDDDDDWDDPYDPNDGDDDDDDWDDWDDWDDPYDPNDPFGTGTSTPIPLTTDDPYGYYEPYATPDPLGPAESGEEEVTYVLNDMVIKTGDVCPAQPGFLFLSSDNTVVTIEGGQLRGVGPGIATVTAYQDGSAVGSCTITVEGAPAKEASSGVNILSIVLWSGIGLILIAMVLIAVILIRRRNA